MADETKTLAESKQWYKSKTVWVNALTLAGGCCAYLVDAQIVKDYPAIGDSLVIVLAVANLLLRFMSAAPVTIKKVK